MGSLLRFPPSDRFVHAFPHFIETGYGDGVSFALACAYPFETLTTVEIHPPAVQAARRRFGYDRRVTIVEGASHEVLPQILTDRGSEPTFFWLDAHFPGGDYYECPLDSEPDYDKRFPLESELRAIRRIRGDGNFFILIDDLRFYADLDWGDKIVPPYLETVLPNPKPGLGFLDPFRATHRVQVLLHDSGYAVIGPRGDTWLEFLP